VSGKLRGSHAIYLGPTTDPLHQYPSYEVVTVNGVSEAIEHRAMEPVFFISDDPAVLSQLGLRGAVGGRLGNDLFQAALPARPTVLDRLTKLQSAGCL
jgi:hypothetical protein